MTREPERIDTGDAGVSRRGFLAAGAGAAALAIPGARARQAPIDARRADRPARNIIFMISDGMSMGTLSLADMHLRETAGRESAWVKWIRESGAPGGPARALLGTASEDSLVTDSAAAVSAWSIGERVRNGAINIASDWRAPEPLWRRAKRAGKATGLVTTTRVTHATPAGFVAHVPRRDMEDEIARQIVDAGVDVALGGGARHWPADLLARRAGEVVRTREALRGAGAPRNASGSPAPLLGLFHDSHMSFELERPETEPTLAEMTLAALAALERAPDGFALHIEGGRVDHAAHQNDAAALVKDQIAFDEALAGALRFVRERDDTLLICTTDHGNANPSLHEYGPEANAKFRRLSQVRRSTEWMMTQIGTIPEDDRSPGVLRNILGHATGLEITEAEAACLSRWTRGETADIARVRNGLMTPIGAVLSNHLGVGFLGPNHTAELVECTATGPGSEAVRRCAHLTDLCAVVSGSLGLPPGRTEQVTPLGAPGAQLE